VAYLKNLVFLIHCVNHAGALSLVYCDITVQASYKFACFRSGIGRERKSDVRQEVKRWRAAFGSRLSSNRFRLRGPPTVRCLESHVLVLFTWRVLLLRMQRPMAAVQCVGVEKS